MKMKKATVIEMVLFNINEGITTEFAQKELIKINDFLVNQPGFVSREISLSDTGQFLDLVYWTDMDSAKIAAEKAMQDPEFLKICRIIDEKTELFKHFHIFNEIA
jgi:hypothetical protein